MSPNTVYQNWIDLRSNPDLSSDQDWLEQSNLSRVGTWYCTDTISISTTTTHPTTLLPTEQDPTNTTTTLSH
ncbi:hypothetical protein PGT21_013798 [Puccinia graminis f. sp. tritici]|uniref:Uncharacterized protein n=1 Tax=Puccinia graminis f. sp. tritici TaxID=56615 RepID=A0A5B0M1N6_PUCGR|nr:hypothetical protein PGT21_013798 [Puccinia graminis f. sp. tritici]